MSFSSKNLIRHLSIIDVLDNDSELYLLTADGNKVAIKSSKFVEILSRDIIEKNFHLNDEHEEPYERTTGDFVTTQALSVILSSLLTQEQLTEALNNFVTKTEFTESLSEPLVNAKSSLPVETFISSDDLSLAIESLVTKVNLQEILGFYISNANLIPLLESFCKKEDLALTIENFITNLEFEERIGNFVNQTSLNTLTETLVTKEVLSLTLQDFITENDLNTLSTKFVNKTEVSTIVETLSTKTELSLALEPMVTKTDLALSLTVIEENFNPFVGSKEVLLASKTFYVRKNGNDINSGLLDTAEGAFLTIQKAIDKAISYNFNNSKFEITIQVAPGIYEENLELPPLTNSNYLNSLTSLAKVTLLGKVGTYTTASDVVIKPLENKPGIHCFGNTASYHLNGFTLDCSLLPQPNNGFLIENGAKFDITSLSLLLSAGNSGIVAVGKNTIVYYNYSNLRLEGNGKNFIGCYDGAEINFSPSSLNLISNPSITTFVIARNSAVVKYYASVVNGVGTGKRFEISVLSTINTNGGGKSFISGSIAGVMSANAGSFYY